MPALRYMSAHKHSLDIIKCRKELTLIAKPSLEECSNTVYVPAKVPTIKQCMIVLVKSFNLISLGDIFMTTFDWFCLRNLDSEDCFPTGYIHEMNVWLCQRSGSKGIRACSYDSRLLAADLRAIEEFHNTRCSKFLTSIGVNESGPVFQTLSSYTNQNRHSSR